MDPFWESITVPKLAQGDLLRACAIPNLPADFDRQIIERPDKEISILFDEVDLVVMTQTCDLENEKAPLVACCPIWSLPDLEAVMPQLAKKGEWEKVRRGRVEGLHLLASPTTPTDNRQALAVDFRSIFSLPIGYLTTHATGQCPRWRLRSPYLEHFSQAFARFFMRVGLPSSIPPF